MRKQSKQPGQNYTQNQIDYYKNRIAELGIQRNELDREIKYNETVLLNLQQPGQDRLVIPQKGQSVKVQKVAEIILAKSEY